MPASITITLNAKPAEVTTPGGLRFVLTTLSLTPGESRDNDFIQYRAAQFKPR